MKHLRIIAVGRLKTPFWREAADHYFKRLNHTVGLTVDIVKDANPALPVEQKKGLEARAILALTRPGEALICMDEKGKSFTSEQFAFFLKSLAKVNQKPCFALGGAFGLGDEARDKADHILSLGPMTFPHELARVLLLEQLYRAERILAGSGYHH